MTNEIIYAYTSHIGMVRDRHEDNFCCCGDYLPIENLGTEGHIRSGSVLWDSCPFFAVFDGMGGESCGEIAAFLAAEEFARYRDRHLEVFRQHPGVYLEDVCTAMNRHVTGYAADHRIETMGTTAVMAFFHHDGVLAANLGDSRLYRWREGVLDMLSTDHVAEHSMFGKPPLTQYLGLREEEMRLECAARVPGCQANDILLLCSDGVTDMLPEEVLAYLLDESEEELSGEEAEAALCRAAARIQAEALARGGRDNLTLVLLLIPERKRPFLARWRKVR